MYKNIRQATAIALSSLCMVLTGCGMGSSSLSTPNPPGAIKGTPLHGNVFGGQQPLGGAAVYLYATGTTGYGSAYANYPSGSSSLLGSNVVTTDAMGGFNITGDYTCPPNSYVYLEAIGGTPDYVGTDNNPNVIQLAGLGPCSGLASLSFINLNELTTIASAWALAPFMSGPTNIGTTASNTVGLANAFASINTLVNIATGKVNTTLPAGATIPTAELNTLGNILAACVNTPKGTASGAGSPCVLLFNYATPPGGITPTDTLTASMDIAQHPSNNVGSLFLLAAKYSQFGPTLLTSPPTDFTIAIRYTGGGAFKAAAPPTGIAADQSGNIWVTTFGATAANDKLVELGPNGALIAAHASSGYAGVAVDLNGNAWSTYNFLVKTTGGAAGVSTAYDAGGGLISGSIPAVAVDGSGNIWASSVKYNLAGLGNKIVGGTLAEFSPLGTAISPAAGYTGGGEIGGQSLAITNH